MILRGRPPGSIICLFIVALLSPEVCVAANAGSATVSLITEGKLGSAGNHGVTELRNALLERHLALYEDQDPDHARGDYLIVLHANPKTDPSPEEESYSLRVGKRNGKTEIEVSGGGDVGLMYALSEIAERIGWSVSPVQPFAKIHDESRKPDVRVRSISMYTMNRAYFESRFYDETYWIHYFDLLARCRFNNIVLIFGYENAGYFAPAYPYFFDVDGFRAVHVAGLSKEQQQKNLRALRRMVALAHERGLRFTVGLWDHIYRGGVQGPAELANHPTDGLVQGVTADNLTSYIPAAFAKFLKVFPEIDTIQFRMHTESGLKASEMNNFWETMYQIMKTAPRTTTFEFRLKDFPDNLIQRAVDLKLNFRLATKYWAEQLGMPYHPTHIQAENQHDRRHGYADVLRYPKEYDMDYRLFNGGTTRILLWGDPEYARRFASSSHLYDGVGYEVNEPLATKMERQPSDVAPFQLLNPPYRYYDYEFERYWHFFQVFGRMGYDPQTPAAVFDREFNRRFGPAAGPLIEEALHLASWILPRIIAYSLPGNLFPTTRGWPEKQRWDDLEAYAASTPSDTQQFESFREAAARQVSGTYTAKVTPQQTAVWFDGTASKVLALIGQAEHAGVSSGNKEFVSTTTDLKILASLARYHAARIPAAVSLNLYRGTQDSNSLDDAIVHYRKAIEAWKTVIDSAGNVYNSNLRMGLEEFDLTGHWKDELPKLQADLRRLEKERPGTNRTLNASRNTNPLKTRSDVEPPVVVHHRVIQIKEGQPVRLTARVTDVSGIDSVRVLYRAVDQYQDFRGIEMHPDGQKDEFAVEIPADQINPRWDFMYLIEAIDKAGNGRIYPNLEKETPYIIVRIERPAAPQLARKRKDLPAELQPGHEAAGR